jgi:hypothetical protein
LYVANVNCALSPLDTLRHPHALILGSGSKSYNSAGAPLLCHAAGRVWFEVELLEESPNNYIRVGFAGTNFRGTEVGADAASWAVLPQNGKTRHGLILPTRHPRPHN